MSRFRRSPLVVESGLGMPDVLKRAFELVDERKTRGVKQFDMTDPARELKSAESLLSKGMLTLLESMRSTDVNSVDINYVVDRSEGQLTVPAIRTAQVGYASVSEKKQCVVSFRESHIGKGSVTQAEGVAALRQYARRTNSEVKVGDGREMHHLMLQNQGADVRALLVAMWLIHLEVVAGADISVNVDARDVRQHMPLGTRPEDECDVAKQIPGVRVHVNSLDRLARAMLVAACDPNAATTQGLSARTSRYIWPRTRLTLYGGALPISELVRFNDPFATVRVILAFGDRYADRESCGIALETALWMYGTHTISNQVELQVTEANLHQDVHTPPAYRAAIWHCQVLSAPELVALAKFVGLGMNQMLGQTLRAACNVKQMKDVDNAEQFFINNHGGFLAAVGRLVSEQLKPLMRTYLSIKALLSRNVRSLWMTTGVAHCLMMGCVVENTLLSTATKVMRVPTFTEVAITDDPQRGGTAKEAAAQLYVVGQLVDNCGGMIRRSVTATAVDLPNGAAVSPDTQLHAGHDVRMVLIGLRGGLLLQKLSKDAWGFNPSPDTLEQNLDTTTGQSVVIAHSREKPLKLGDNELTNALINLRGPMAPTRVMRVQGRKMKVSAADTDVGIPVEVIAPNAAEAVARMVKEEWGPQPTSGEGLLCGARAIRGSLEAQTTEVGSTNIPSLDQLVDVLQGVVDKAAEEATEEYLGANYFREEQLQAVVEDLGMRLGIIDHVDNQVRARVTAGTGAVLWVHHDGRNHWESIGPSEQPFRAVKPPERAGQSRK